MDPHQTIVHRHAGGIEQCRDALWPAPPRRRLARRRQINVRKAVQVDRQEGGAWSRQCAETERFCRLAIPFLTAPSNTSCCSARSFVRSKVEVAQEQHSFGFVE